MSSDRDWRRYGKSEPYFGVVTCPEFETGRPTLRTIPGMRIDRRRPCGRPPCWTAPRAIATRVPRNGTCVCCGPLRAGMACTVGRGRTNRGLDQSSGPSGVQAFQTNSAGSVRVAGPMRRALSSLIPAARAAAMSLSWSPMRSEPFTSRLRSRAAARINPGLGLRHSQFLCVGSTDNGWWGHK